MQRVRLSPGSVAASRFAVGPLVDLDVVLRELMRPRARIRSARLEEMRPAYRRLARRDDVRALLALQRPFAGAGFVSPPPRGMGGTVEDALEAVRTTPSAVVRAEVGDALRERRDVPADLRAILRADTAAEVLAGALADLWDALLADAWPATLAILERDVLHRGAQLARRGWGGALADLHPRLRWTGEEIEISRVPDQVTDVEDGLVLVPSAGPVPQLRTYVGDRGSWPEAIVYPARSSGVLWETPEPVDRGALGRLLGPRRAAVLAALDEPGTTTQLATRLGLPLGSVGDHLKVLLDAGLVDRARAGHAVSYSRTRVGEALVGVSA